MSNSHTTQASQGQWEPPDLQAEQDLLGVQEALVLRGPQDSREAWVLRVFQVLLVHQATKATPEFLETLALLASPASEASLVLQVETAVTVQIFQRYF